MARSTASPKTSAALDGADRVLPRIGGVAALAFLSLLVVQNLIRAAEPGFAAPPGTVAGYFFEHRTAVVVPLALFPVGLVSLLCFASSMRSVVRDARDRFLADLGTLAVVLIAALFAVINGLEIALAAMAGEAALSPGAVAGLWAVHAAVFAVNLAAIAVALTALSALAVRHALSPRWFAVAGPAGGACLFVAALSSVAVVGGSPVLYVGFAGFLIWGLFLLCAGARLLRSPSPSRGHLPPTTNT